MGSKDFFQMRKLAAKGVIGQITDDDGVAIRLKAKSDAGSVTSVTVTTANDIEMITANGGTETFEFGTYTTVGALADAINASSYWECKILDTRRDEETDTQFIDGVISSSTVDGETYYDVKTDTSACKYMAYRLTYDRGVGTNKPKGGHRVHLQEIVTNITCGGGADSNSLKSYEIDGSDETKLYQQDPTTGSEETINWASGEAKLTAGVGKDLLVIVTDGTSITGTLTVIGERE